MPKISVIMPTYNANRYLHESIDSIVSQTVSDWELIIINEPFSNDDTEKTIYDYAAKDSRIKLIQNDKHIGISASLNVGIDAARGEYIARMDADDISLPKRFERQVEFLENNTDIDVLGIKPINIGAKWQWNTETDASILKADCLFYSPFVHSTIMMRTYSLWKNRLYYNENCKYTEDYEFFAHISDVLRFSNLIDEDLFHYRIHTESATNKGNKEEGIPLYKKVMRNLLEKVGADFTDHEIDILCVLTAPKPEYAAEAINYISRLDLLLKRLFFNDAAIDKYGKDALYHTVQRRWKESLNDRVTRNRSVSEAFHRGFFCYPRAYKPKKEANVSQKPKVSVVLPTYNSEKYIADSLRTIFEQTFDDFELLLINEYGSDDNTVRIAMSFRDPRLRVLQNTERLGLADSLNRGILEAQGTYIARADSDDLYPLHRFQKQINFMDSNPDVGVCGSWQRHFGRVDFIHKPPEKHEYIKACLLFSCNICHSTLMLRREAFINNNLMYDNSYLAEDFELWSRAVHLLRFHTIQEVLGEYRVSGDQITEQKKEKLIIEHSTIVARTLSERLSITISPEDLAYLSGWTNPFSDPGRASNDEDRKRMKKLFDEIRQQNRRIKAYGIKALDNVLSTRKAWASSSGYVSLMITAKRSYRMKNFIKKAFMRMVYPAYRPVYRKIIQPIADMQQQLADMRWTMNNQMERVEQELIRLNDYIEHNSGGYDRNDGAMQDITSDNEYKS